MKKVLITGGTGKLGKEIVNQLLFKKYQITVLSTKKRLELPKSVLILKADLTNIYSLKNNIKDFQIIIHCASNPKDSENVDFKGTLNLLQSINNKELPHIIYISIVGVDKSTFPYYQHKYQAETIIQESEFPWTILRITQFHDFVLHQVIDSLDNKDDSIFKVPKQMAFQSIDIKNVAEFISSIISDDPKNSIITLGGPEVLNIKDMVKIYLTEVGRSAKIKEVITNNSFYKIFTTGINLCPNEKIGTIKWGDFIRVYLDWKNHCPCP